MSVITFIEYVPPIREDNVAWYQALIEEASASTGPWTLIDTITLDPLDIDPSDPAARSFTTDNAVLTNGWYRVTFKDASNNLSLPSPAQYNAEIPAMGWEPTPRDVAGLLRTRTKNSGGVEQGTFNNQTRPNAEQTVEEIQKAVDDVMLIIGADIPPSLYDAARTMTALKAAMRIELSYFPEQIPNRSPYAQLKILFDEQKEEFVARKEAILTGDDVGAGVGSKYPQWSFPPADNMLTRPW